MTLRIHNTLSRSLETFVPIEPGRVRMYVCGITVYDLCHMGHARMMIAFDVVQRWLRASGYQVTYARNITDIDDKIIRRALERGISIRELTEEQIGAMHRDLAAIGIEPPTLEPRATDFIPEMTAMIGRLEAKGLAYRAPGGDVNYSVRKFPGYGQLSGKTLDALRAGERVEIVDDKDDPFDFALWKAAKPGEPADAIWPSPFGPGRPGWHIECSAMSCTLLGERFDLHGGGMDLEFPHHENEIAQSVGANGPGFARYWLHNGFLNIDNEKMSKSLGNFFTIREVLERYDGETLRFFMLRTHYRSPFNFSDASLQETRVALRRLYTALDGSGGDTVGDSATSATIDWQQPQAAAFRAAMDEDFNTPGALAVLFELAGELNRAQNPERAAAVAELLRALGGVLGVLQQSPREFLQAGTGLDEAAIRQRIDERAAAKAGRDFARADAIRADLAGQGVLLQDSAAGTTWTRA